MSETKRKKKKNNTVLLIAMIACLCVMAYSGFRLITTLLEYRRGTEEYDGLRQYTSSVSEDPKDPENPEEPEEPAEQTAAVNYGDTDMHTAVKPPIQVDWTSLKKLNSDIVGWIYVGAIDISYPVVQGDDDEYYLHRTFERADNFAGSIFVESRNSGDFSDPNTIVYGHNMKNGSMFGMLAHIQTDELYAEDPWIWILTPEGNYRYRMFSMYHPAVESSTYTLFQGTDEKFTNWCEEMFGLSEVEMEKPTFSVNSRIVTLSTCTSDPGHRFVVQGVAVR